MRSQKYPSYEERFGRFSRSVEKWLVGLVILLLLSLTFTQILLHFDTVRAWLVEVERLEGVAS
ncbi:hypothetical protein [Ammoniphilus sp. CFH 90114]|uniref:hypothetical protein n=1 Tax=Ammoniphilus sp. CFH 90114 TaxID=2493665 RepID=UPI00100F8429|nr:hypothetical protein [Ammoniphilus sp. CFH 90114]RXT13884.1 hypothetical protein EIZ39_07020 [Ammoniphilus sp. CFH 90114]